MMIARGMFMSIIFIFLFLIFSINLILFLEYYPMKKNKKKARESETGLPVSYYNWEMGVKEGGSGEEGENSLGITAESFKEYLKAWKKKSNDPEKK